MPTVALTLLALGFLLGLFNVPSVLIERKGRPTAALAWMMALLLLPYLGPLLWWSIGRLYLRRRRRRRHRAKAAVISRLTDVRRDLGPDRVSGKHALFSRATAREQARALVFTESDLVFRSRAPNHVRLLIDATAAYDAMERAIRAAEHHVHFQFYIYQVDATGRRFRDLLAERARAGIRVRVLVDGVGGASAAGEFFDPLRAAGAFVSTFLPLRFLRRRLSINFRNHRKILVVDGRVAFTGGLNIGDEYMGAWHDLALQLEGPVVDQLQEVFAEDWYFAEGFSIATRRYFGRFDEVGKLPMGSDPRETLEARCRIIASGPDAATNLMFQVFFLACTTATERIYIVTPYFIPDQAMMVALCSAAERGVDVRLMLPRTADVPFASLASRSYYDGLIASGVRVFEYEPGILHAKALIFDRDWAVCGSANVDIRSFRLNFEAGCFMEGEAVNARLTALFEADLERCREVDRAALAKRSWGAVLKEAAAHLFSPLL